MATALLSGCTNPLTIESRGTVSADPAISEPLEAPHDGKILVRISGNATKHGQAWVPEDASLATIEDLFAVRPEWASRHILIQQRDNKRAFEYRLDQLSRSEREKIKIHHGDSICFFWDRCFGFVPDHTPRPATDWL